jgi:hypothetical protein
MSITWIDREMAKAVGKNLSYLHSVTFNPQEGKTDEEIGNFVWQFILSLKHEIESKSNNESYKSNLKRIKHAHALYKEMEKKRNGEAFRKRFMERNTNDL